MDIKNVNVNINNLYSAVRNVGNNDTQILEPLGGGGWQISQVKDLTPEQKEQNRKFRNGLYDSLKGMTSDDSVINDLRNTLGIPEKTNENEDKKADADKPLMARDIKKAIELVMKRVDERIHNVLTTKFPPAVQQLIREAVRENPQHKVVKEFLGAEKGTVDDLAKLCRLTFQCMKGAADPSVLAYLNGFAHKVEDFTDVTLVHAHDKAQYDAGKAHYDSEVKKNEGNDDKVKNDENKDNKDSNSEVKDDKAKNNEVKDDKNSNSENTKVKVKKEQESSDEIKIAKLYHSLTTIEDEEEECSAGTILKKTEKLDKVNNKNDVDKNDENKNNEVKNEKNNDNKKSNDNNVKVDAENDVKDNVDEGEVDPTVSFICGQLKEKKNKWDLPKFTDVLIKDKNKDFSKRINSFLNDSCGDDTPKWNDYLWKLIDEIHDLIGFKEKLQDPVKLLEEAIFGVKATVRKPSVFGEAVKLCTGEIRKLEAAIKNRGLSKLRQKPLNDLLSLVSDPLKNQQSELYETASKAYTRSMRATKTENEVAKEVANVIKTAIINALDDNDLRTCQEVVPTDPKVQNAQYTENTLLTQGNTNMCYLRSLENALLAKGKTLPKPVDGTYTFDVTFANGENVMGEKLTFTRQITVEKDEIQALKDWYAQNRKDDYERQKNDLTDLDWAVNIAQTKKEAVQNVLNKNGGNETEKTKEAKNCKIEKLSGDTISSKDVMGKYNVTNQLITETGRDDAVAALFGLTSEPVSISINHAGYVLDPDQTLESYLQSEDADLEPAALYEKFNEVRNWKKANPDGILTLHEAGRHFVTVTGFYFKGDNDFGFIVRDSNKAEGKERTINVVGYVYDQVWKEGNCQKLSVHCFKQGA